MNSNNTSNVDPNGQVPNGTTPLGQVPTPQGQVPSGQPQGNVSIDNLPQAWQDHIKELRSSDASTRVELNQLKAEQKKQEEARQAEVQKRLQEQGEWQKVAEQSATRVKELEPVQERYAALSTLLADQIKAQVKDWPKEVKDLLPGDDTPIEVRYSQVQKLQALASKVADQAQTQQRASLPGNTPGPRQVNSEQTRDQQKEEFRLRRKQSGMYGL